MKIRTLIILIVVVLILLYVYKPDIFDAIINIFK